jgi:hypothetical protein
MATLHPSFPAAGLLDTGFQRERDVLELLELGLPAGYELFHNVDWSRSTESRQQVGEIDIAVVAPSGYLLLVEVKLGAIDEDESGLFERRAQCDEALDVGRRLRRSHSVILSRLIDDDGLSQVRVGTLLVLPDHRVEASVLAGSAERLVDAAGYPDLCQRVRDLMPLDAFPLETREHLLAFLSKRFSVLPDVSARIGQFKRLSTSMSPGLATWVPAIEHQSGLFVIEASAGSGKTQLALALMRQAHRDGQRCAYVCYNQALADHMARIAPASAKIMTFHEACVEHAQRSGIEPDFARSGVHDELAAHLVAATASMTPRWDLLIIDETQDFESEWVQALGALLKAGGRTYLMGDARQRIHWRDGFVAESAVHIRCMDNFRSPRKVVEAINLLRLTDQPIVSRSAFVGRLPGFVDYPAQSGSALALVEARVRELLREGFKPAHIAVLTYGRSGSEVLGQDKIAGLRTRRFTGRYDGTGNALWSDGTLLVETLDRFKGQSAPAVILCEIDFEQVTEIERRKLFVGMSRAQVRLDCVLSERAARGLLAV